MPSNDADGDDVDPETVAAVRQAIRAELRSLGRALSQIGAGLLVGLLAVPVAAGALLVLGAPLALVLVVMVGAILLLVAYGWSLPPFR